MISIVQYSRNDDHGGNLLKRMQFSYYTNIYLLEKAQIKSEIIMVDYNTPKEKDNLYKLLPVSENLKFVTIRHIIVPPEIHQTFKDYNKLPMNNMVARNIGIRRAKGEYILSTGVDVIFSYQLVKQFKNLLPNRLYRVHRYDVNRCILNEEFNVENILEKCEKNIIDIHFNTNLGKFESTDIPSLHTNNCGDFQLAHKDVWFNLNGYPEIDLMGTHSDTIFSYMSYLSGNKEIVLDEKFFHIDHESRWLKPIYTHILRNWRMLYREFGYDVMKYKKKYYELAKEISNDLKEEALLEKIDYEILSIDKYKQIILDMINKKRSLVYNEDSWGNKEYNFKEVVIGANG